jgi:OOP family OmpA-OmpF porin
MGNWRRWLRIGLAGTILLAIVAFALRIGTVEDDLTQRVASRLADEGHVWASVVVAGRDVTITGTAPTTESQQLAAETAGSVPGVRAVANLTGLLPIAAPYVWSARRLGKVVTLSGFIPSESFRNSILAATRRAVPDAQIHDEMTLARGASAGFNTGTVFALARLAGLGEGLVTLTDATFSVSGVAATPASFVESRQAFQGGLPSALVLGPVDILPAPAERFVWAAAYDSESVTFSGFVPNEVTRETLIAAAKANFAGVPIVDQLEIASGEPDGFAEAASFALAALSRLSEGGVMLDGLTLDVAGRARTVDEYESALRGLTEGLPKGVTVVADDIKPAVVSPYEWHGEKDGASVVLSGYVPSLAVQGELKSLARAQFAGQLLTDRTRVAAGEPKMDWIGGIKFAMGELAKLNRGTVNLGDRSFSIEGEATSPDAFAEIIALNQRTLPASLELADASVVPPHISPYRFVAETGRDLLTLAGYVPSEEDKQAILEAARENFGRTTTIEDKLVFASGAPEEFLPAISASLKVMNRLGGARTEILDGAIKLEGSAYNPSAAGEIADAANEELPQGYETTVMIATRQDGQPVGVDRCLNLVQGQLQRRRIEFSGAKAALASDSLGALDRIAAVLARCPDTDFEVGAHSDADGSTSKNRDLTQARAEAVVDYLVDAGVKRERLTPAGYGEANPIADNSTTEGKAANRRIEFTLKVAEVAKAPPDPEAPGGE